jgi:CubicO group peptidase (beta-lactamase class C family)
MAPSTQHKYSDLAYQLLGEIVSRVTGVPYPRYLTESVLDPLEMTATGFEPLPGPLLGQRATGYGWRALSDDLDPAPPMSPIWAEGGLWSCVPDLARWISFQLAGYQQPPGDPPVLAAGSAPVLAVGTPPVLAAGSLRDMHRPRYLTDDTWTRAWGISWCATRRDDVTWIEHSGGLPGFTSTICFDPVTGVGAIVLINGTSGSVELGLNLASIARRLVSAAPPVIERPGPVPAEYRSLLGCYARPGFGGWILRLEWRSGRLTFTSADLASWSLALEPTADPDVFIAGPGSNFTGENVVFRRLADHRVTSVLLVESTFMRLDPVAAGPARSQAI